MDIQGKTPASFLQELCVKKHWTPEYNLIQGGNELYSPVFTYKLNCSQYRAHGSGTSKKDAKQNAATNMLNILISIPDCYNDGISRFLKSIGNKEETSVYEVSVKGNAVGFLDDFCSTHQLPSAKYEEIREEGPSHAKKFSISCSVYDMKKEAVSSTKKQAKQIAAAEMNTWLRSVADYELTSRNSMLIDNDDEFIEQCKMFPEVVPILSLNLENIGKQFAVNTVSETLTNIVLAYKEETFLYNERCVFTLLKTILSEMLLNYRVKNMGKVKKKIAVAITIECVPEISCLGMGKSSDRAMRNASRNVIKMLCKYCTNYSY